MWRLRGTGCLTPCLNYKATKNNCYCKVCDYQHSEQCLCCRSLLAMDGCQISLRFPSIVVVLEETHRFDGTGSSEKYANTAFVLYISIKFPRDLTIKVKSSIARQPNAAVEREVQRELTWLFTKRKENAITHLQTIWECASVFD